MFQLSGTCSDRPRCVVVYSAFVSQRQYTTDPEVIKKYSFWLCWKRLIQDREPKGPKAAILSGGPMVFDLPDRLHHFHTLQVPLSSGFGHVWLRRAGSQAHTHALPSCGWGLALL
eukprot:5258789-Amphidinium_carterae.1